MNTNRQSLNERKRKFADLSTAELLAIVEGQDSGKWTEEDLDAASELLEDRRAGIAVSPAAVAVNKDSREAPPSVVVLRVCAFLYFAISVIGATVILAQHEALDANIAYFVFLTLFQGLVVCTFLLVIALIAHKVTNIATILDRRR